MKTLTVFAFLLLPAISYALDSKPFKDGVVLLPKECQVTIVEMNTGELKVTHGDIFTANCRPAKSLEVNCDWYDSKNKLYNSKKMIGGMQGSEGVIGLDTDTFILNGITKKFYSESSIVIDDGRVRGKKVCAGNWLYEKDVDDFLAKRKKK